MEGRNDWRRIPSRIEDLTVRQVVVLENAWEAASLVDVLNASVPEADAPFWNRKWKYVPEISAAAVTMLEFGFIDVHEGEQPLVNSAALLLDRARPVLQDPANWWAFDPDDDGDPTETQELAAAGATAFPIADFWIVETTSAQKLGGHVTFRAGSEIR